MNSPFMNLVKKLTSLVLLLATANTYGDDRLSSSLSSVHQNIVADYEGVEHLTAQQLSLMESESIVIFDIREVDEFAVSHIDNAIQVDPDVSADDFLEVYADTLKNKTAIFYCSVGRRSSEFISRVIARQNFEPPTKVYNLSGGLFHWHNLAKPLVNLQKQTMLVHPYNFYWGRLILRKSFMSYSP